MLVSFMIKALNILITIILLLPTDSTASTKSFLKEEFDQIVKFWQPYIKLLKNDTFYYWTPRIENKVIYFHNKIHPYIIEGSRQFDQEFGNDFSNFLYITETFWIPIIKNTRKQTTDYWEKNHQDLYHSIVNLPAPFKKFVDGYIRFSMRTLSQSEDLCPEEAKDKISFLSEIKNRAPIEYSLKANHLLNEIAGYSLDENMKNCYKITAFESKIPNAFNIGCNIYISTGLMDELNNDQIQGVIAHELSHGDFGHAAKNILNYFSAAGEHFSKLIYQEIYWLMTGNMEPYFEKVISDGNIPLLIDIIGKKAPAQELMADCYGARLLKRASKNPNSLKNALYILHGYKPGEKIPEDENIIDDIRDYPSLYSRLKNIDHCLEANL